MTLFDRRRFLILASGAIASLKSFGSAAQAANPEAPSLTLVHPDQIGSIIPTSFIGLSYETQQLADPNFFSAANDGLIAQFRALSIQGVLRLGGNTSDVGWFRFTPETKPPTIATRTVVTGEPSAKQSFFITPEAIQNLRGFLEATGWACLYGLNLGTGTPERAAEEAAVVTSILGPSLEHFQIGNEPDLFGHHMRDPKKWNVDAYLDEWLAFADAIRARVPQARFGLPDTSGNPQWSERIVERLAAMPPGTGKGTRPRIAAITHHYYFGDPPENPDVNIDRLLHADPRVSKVAASTQEAAGKLSVALQYPVRYRMAEGNTCYRGGKPGVSDVFAAALWAADYILLLASLGYSGVNLHGGTRNQVAASLGGVLPGEALLANPNDPHPRPFYTPIAQIDGKYVLEPVFYGMHFAGQFAGGSVIQVNFDPGPVNATAYAAKLPSGQNIVAIVNKDSSRALPLTLPGFKLVRTLSAQSLMATKVDETEVTDTREITSVPPITAMLFYATGK